MKYFDDCQTLEQLTTKWRELCRVHHPDRGGDKDIFQDIAHQYHGTKARLKAPRKCPVCNGTGKVKQTHGFNTLNMPCKPCKGTGKISGDL